ncbi:MAG TPA: hypothetical protein VHM67_15885 [Gemmatimonadaceae bacterium]|nr:hypothetical protein [Gemmatimonadaceae bacterium]
MSNVAARRRVGARQAIVLLAVASVAACTLPGVVRTRQSAVSGLITEDDLRVSVDTLIRSSCERIMETGQASGMVKVRVTQDVFDNEIKASVTKSSGDAYFDAMLADLVTQLPPRYPEQAQKLYNPRYDVAVRYTCHRDAYGVTGEAAIQQL